MTGLPGQLVALAVAAAQAIIRLMSMLIGLLGQHNAAALVSGLALLLIVALVVRYAAVLVAAALVLTLLASSPIWRAEARVTRQPCQVSASPRSPQSPGRTGTGCAGTSPVSRAHSNASQKPAPPAAQQPAPRPS
jgi:hypothetical protein